MADRSLAFDKSARRIDVDGKLHVSRSHISKATVNPYYGYEVPGWESLGLERDRVYKFLRAPDELQKGASTFANMPILSKHVPITTDSIQDDPSLKDLIIGAVGSNVSFDAPYLDGDKVFWDNDAIAGIESGKWRELSCSYRWTPDMTPGEFEGEAYDGVMRDLIGNHLALVETGRAGSDVMVADSINGFDAGGGQIVSGDDATNHPSLNEEPTMKLSKLGKALLAVIGIASPKLAADSKLPELVGNADRKTFKKEALMRKLIAMDSDLDADRMDDIIDAVIGVEEDPEPSQTEAAAADESPEEKIRAMLSGKVEDDVINAILGMISAPAAVDEDMVDEKVEAAMDAMRKGFIDAANARKDVADVVGDLDVAMDAESVYGFALDHMKIDRAGVTGVPALKALFKAANKPAPAVATDAATVIDASKRFPNLTRFGQA